MTMYQIERRAANRPPPAPPPGDAFGLRTATDAVLQHGRIVAAIFVAALVIALLYLWMAAPIYRADTVLEVDGRSRQSLLPNFASQDRLTPDGDRAVASAEIEVLRSRDLLIPAILGAGADIELSSAWRYGFVPIGQRHGIVVPTLSVPDAWRGRSLPLVVEGPNWRLDDDTGKLLASGKVGEEHSFMLGAGPAKILVLAPEDISKTRLKVQAKPLLSAFTDVSDRLRMFEAARDSGVLRVSLEDTRPERAAALLNGLVTRYIVTFQQRRASDAQRALAYLEQQLPTQRERTQGAEDSLRKFQKATTAAPMQAEIESSMRQRAELERQKVELNIKRDRLAQTLTPKHPELAAVLAQLGTVNGALHRLSVAAENYPEQQLDATRLQRDVQSATQQYLAMQLQVQQLRMSTSALFPGVRQLDPAIEPFEPVRPRAAATLSIGAGIGLLLGLASALALRALQPTVNDAQELEGGFATPPMLVIIPQSDAQMQLMDQRLRGAAIDEHLGMHRVLALAAPEDAAVESLRSVHLSLMLRGRNMPAKVVLVTAPTSGTGKSFVATNLAALMAESGKRVLLIEADLRKPGIHQFVELDEFAPGLTDVLVGERRLDEVIRSHVAIDMDVILHGTASANPGSLFLSPMFESCLNELRERYDHIIINGAAVLPSGDAMAVGRLADFALLIVRAEQSLLRETRVAQKRLEDAGIKLEGILVNGVKRNRLGTPRLH
jgi:tyrosine-protein kinase Etk/Wzc